MKFKLDENIGSLGEELLRSAGHDVATVRDQKISGVEPERIRVHQQPDDLDKNEKGT